jgi:protein-S-isoprenylcysteine O-methyltransferase Ste14
MLGIAGVAGIVLFSAPVVREGNAIDVATETIGYCLLMGYVVLRVWATLYISGRKHRELLTQGPYSVTRNPLYLGTFCLAFSIPFLFQSVVLLVAAVATVVVYAFWLIPAEERALEEIFGDEFRAYRSRTPMLLPRLSLYHADSTIHVNLGPLPREARRLCSVALVFVLAELFNYLRSANWWPRLFTLP